MKKITKIALVGAHGTGKSTICQTVLENLTTIGKKNDRYDLGFVIENQNKLEEVVSYIYNVKFIPEQFREIVKDCNGLKDINHSENITLATYAKQLYLENLYTAQGKNILCDRGVLDTFIYYEYFNKYEYRVDSPYDYAYNTTAVYMPTYSKIYLIEPSDRKIANDGFRMTDKKEQLEVHKLFLEYFKDFKNVVIVNQEKQNEIVEMIVNDFNV